MQHYGHRHFTALLREYDITISGQIWCGCNPPDHLQAPETAGMEIMYARPCGTKETLYLYLYLMRHEVLLCCSDWLQTFGLQ